MAWIVADSFDYYGSTADVARSVWDSATTALFPAFGTGATTRFGVGQSLRPQAAGVLVTKNLASNEATIFSCFAYYRGGALSGTTPEIYVQLRDGATAQCTVVMESSGNIVLKRGDHTGTVVATYTAAFAQDVWSHFQIRVVIDPTVGTFTVRKNGQTSDTFSATGLNTRSTTNSYANVIALGMGTGATINDYVDDLFFFSGSGAVPNTWVGDVRAICLPPVADTATHQMVPNVTTGTFGAGGGFSQTNPSTELHFSGPFLATRGGTLQKINVTLQAALTGHIKGALYLDDGTGGVPGTGTARPGTLLGTSAEITNPPSGSLDFIFTGGPAVQSGRQYFVGVMQDANIAISRISGAGQTEYIMPRSYAAGFPATGWDPGGSTNVNAMTATFTVGGVNALVVSDLLADGDVTFVAGTNVNDTDLYELGDLPITSLAIIGVVTKVYIKKSDAGSRSGQILLKSGATQVTGPDTVLGTTYTYLSRADGVDPATGAAWTPGAVNALQVGQKVTA
jgi:hypothetical protein